ncbi:MAG: hypothetical protein ACYTDX_08775, partial [Planctomycetota bacterium]
MTGKELGIILAGATIFGGTAGAAAVAISGGNDPAPAPVAMDTADLEERLARLERDLRTTTSERDELQSAVAGLRERLENTEASVAKSVERGHFNTNESGMRITNAEDMFRDSGATIELGEGEDVQQALQKGLRAALEKLGKDGSDARFGFVVDGEGNPDATAALSGMRDRIEGIRNSMSLRLLPEEERWDKAREDLGLNTYQENELKAA